MCIFWHLVIFRDQFIFQNLFIISKFCENNESYDKCEEQRRESFAFRNAEGVHQRLEIEENDANDLFDKHDRYELKWEGERDIEEYKKKCKDQSRESFAIRNTEDIHQRQEKEGNDTDDLCEKLDSYELKRADVNDTEEQKKKCEEQRRERFDFRNDEIVRQRLENDKGSKVNKRWYWRKVWRK